MKANFSVFSAALLCVGCTVPPNFATMSSEELLAYNKDKPVMEQVYCTKQTRTSSRIRRTYCDTVADWVDYNTRTIRAIETLSMPTGSVIRGRD